MDKDLRKLGQVEGSLSTVVHRPPLLCVRLDNTPAPQDRLVPALHQIEHLFHESLSVGAERGQGLAGDAVAEAQFLHTAAQEVPPLVCDDLRREPFAGPVGSVDVDAVAPAVIHLVHDGVGKAGHDGFLARLIAHIEPRNQLGGGVHGQVDIGAAHDLGAVQAGNKVDVRCGGIHLIGPDVIFPCHGGPGEGAGGSLVVGEAVPGDGPLTAAVVCVVVEVVTEGRPCGALVCQMAVRVDKELMEHEVVSVPQGGPFGRIVEGLDGALIVVLVLRRAALPGLVLHHGPGGDVLIVQPQDAPAGGAVLLRRLCRKLAANGRVADAVPVVKQGLNQRHAHLLRGRLRRFPLLCGAGLRGRCAGIGVQFPLVHEAGRPRSVTGDKPCALGLCLQDAELFTVDVKVHRFYTPFLLDFVWCKSVTVISVPFPCIL